MIKLIGLLKRKPGMSMEDFRAYYENNHAPLVQRMVPRADDYRRSYTNLVLMDGKPIDGEPQFDAVVETWFKDQAACDRFVQAMQDEEIGPIIIKDEEQFIDRSTTQILFVEELRSPPL